MDLISACHRGIPKVNLVRQQAPNRFDSNQSCSAETGFIQNYSHSGNIVQHMFTHQLGVPLLHNRLKLKGLRPQTLE